MHPTTNNSSSTARGKTVPLYNDRVGRKKIHVLKYTLSIRMRVRAARSLEVPCACCNAKVVCYSRRSAHTIYGCSSNAIRTLRTRMVGSTRGRMYTTSGSHPSPSARAGVKHAPVARTTSSALFLLFCCSGIRCRRYRRSGLRWVDLPPPRMLLHRGIACAPTRDFCGGFSHHKPPLACPSRDPATFLSCSLSLALSSGWPHTAHSVPSSDPRKPQSLHVTMTSTCGETCLRELPRQPLL